MSVPATPSWFSDRRDAGRQLAERLGAIAAGRGIVLALPRGGVPVAAEIARALDWPLDLMLVRKVGVPWQRELAVAAVAGPEGEVLVVNDDVAASARLDPAQVERLAGPERAELRRRRDLYLGGRPAPVLAGRTVILVDDGAATGATMRAAVAAVRSFHPARVIVALPVGSREALALLEHEADEVICLAAPHPFFAVGAHYGDFPQVSDAEVRAELGRATPPAVPGATG